MKKIFTFLLLVALLAIPRSAQARIDWQIATGNEWRINPKNPGDPTDSVKLEAGTKFFYLKVARATKSFDVFGLGTIWFNYKNDYYDINNFNNVKNTTLGSLYFDAPFYQTTINGYGIYEYDYSYNMVLSDRIVRCFLGYDYILNKNEISGSAPCKNKYGYAISLREAYDYERKLIMTEDEVLAITKLDLSPITHGRPLKSMYSVMKLQSDLRIFSNVTELDITNTRLSDLDIVGSFFPKLKKLTMNHLDVTWYDASSPIAVDVTVTSANLPNLEYLEVGATPCDNLNLKNLPSLKELVITDNHTIEESDYDMNRIKVENCPNLTKIEFPQAKIVELNCINENVEEINAGYFDNLYCQNNNITKLHARGGDVLKCGNNGLETLTIEEGIRVLECESNNLTSLSIPKDRLQYLDCSNNSALSGTLDMSGADYLQKLYCWNCDLTDVTLTNCGSLETLGMSNNRVLSLNVSDSPYLTEFFCNNNKRGTQQLDTITGFADLTGLQYFQCNNNAVRTLDCSRMKQLRELQVSRNNVKELVLSNNPDLKTVICDAQGGKTADGRLLSILKLDGCPSLDSLVCNDNAILSLNLTASTKLTPAKMKAYTQRSVQDVVVLDRNKVCIELPNGVMKTPSASQFQTWATGTSTSGFDGTRSRTLVRDGKTYVVLYDIADDAVGGAQTKADVDFYGKKKRYHYTIWDNNLNESLGKSVMHGQPNDNVTVTTYPYVMYINPLTHDVYTDSVNQENQFYSGTIYLDYDAVVPEGTEVYIAQGLQYGREDMITGGDKTTSGQLNLVKIEKGEGAARVVIPALTPVYVKSPSETGLFSFDRNLDNEALGVLPAGVTYDDNIFKGTLTPLTVDPLSVLTLSRGFKSSESGPTAKSRVGFWRFNNTVVPAHRVYIEATEMDKIGGSNVRGLTFAFFDSEEELPTSINSMPTVDTFRQNNEGWYTISGVRLKAKPTAKGVYIYNGKKLIINQ